MVDREQKTGDRKPSQTRNHIVPMKGMFSVKEAEKVGRDLAKEVGVSEDRIRIETYKKGEAPIEVNPRHRGYGHHWDKRPSEAREVTSNKPIKVRTVFGGWSPPTKEELEAFEAAKQEL